MLGSTLINSSGFGNSFYESRQNFPNWRKVVNNLVIVIISGLWATKQLITRENLTIIIQRQENKAKTEQNKKFLISECSILIVAISC